MGGSPAYVPRCMDPKQDHQENILGGEPPGQERGQVKNQRGATLQAQLYQQKELPYRSV